MGMRTLVVAVLLATATPASYLAAHQRTDGGFAEPGGKSEPELTAWAVLGLVAAGKPPAGAAQYLRSQKPPGDAGKLALRILALRALGDSAQILADRLDTYRRPSGRIGALIDTTIWSVLALRAMDRPAGKRTVRYLIRRQRPSGGWGWYAGGSADSNDTAAAIQALRAAGARGKPIRRGIRYLRRCRNRDGGFGLVRGRASDSQSTAWVIQAFVAAKRKPPRSAFRFLRRMKRKDGSYRYSARYVTTPVFVTAQVLPALARRPFPLHSPSLS
jgi:hypothetical protein